MTLRGQRRARRQQEESRLKRFETGWWGAWRLAEFSRSAEDGTVTYPMGEDVEGLIIYTPDGYMSAQLMKLERPAYASGDFTHGTTEEEAAAAAGYLAYSGPF